MLVPTSHVIFAAFLLFSFTMLCMQGMPTSIKMIAHHFVRLSADSFSSSVVNSLVGLELFLNIRDIHSSCGRVVRDFEREAKNRYNF